MSKESLKEKLIQKIKDTDDPSILEEVSNLFELHEPKAVYHINKKQRQAIEEARNQAKNNQTLSNDQADKEADEWLKE